MASVQMMGVPVSVLQLLGFVIDPGVFKNGFEAFLKMQQANATTEP